jgi:hypothetical protein
MGRKTIFFFLFLMIFHFFSCVFDCVGASERKKLYKKLKLMTILFVFFFSSASTTVPQLNAIPSSLSEIQIPPPEPQPSTIKLDRIRVPPPVPSLAGSVIKVPTTRQGLIELVAANGDSYEENLITQFTKNDLSQSIR